MYTQADSLLNLKLTCPEEFPQKSFLPCLSGLIKPIILELHYIHCNQHFVLY